MRISDWSSGVCSSDLVRRSAHRDVQAHRVFERLEGRDIARQNALVVFFIMTAAHFDDDPPRAQEQLPAVGVRRERRAIARQRQPQRLGQARSEEHTSELQSLMRTSYAVFCFKKN